MTRVVWLLSLLSVGVGGCAGHDRLAARCEWPSETATSLDLRDQSQQRHLRDDARAAEDLAVRYADSVPGPQPPGEHQRAIERCEATLFDAIAHVHGVAAQQVREVLARQNDTPR